MNYVFWKTVTPNGYCDCTSLRGFDDEHLIAYGSPVSDRFPADAHYAVSREGGGKLGDAVDNHDNYILVSAALREFLREALGTQVEFLETSIRALDGSVISDEHSIVNVLAIEDAIDLEASEVKWNNIDPDKITRFRRLVLAEDRIPTERAAFRLKHFTNRLLVRRDLAEAIGRQGFVGVTFVETEGYKR